MAGTTTHGQRYCPNCGPVMGRQSTEMGFLIVTEAPRGKIYCSKCGSDTAPMAFADCAAKFLAVKDFAKVIGFVIVAIIIIVALIGA